MMRNPFRAARKELGLLTDSEFFREVGNRAGYLDPEFVKRVYNGMLDVLYAEMRTKGALRFPQLCDFYITQTEPRYRQNNHMVVPKLSPSIYQVRVVPMYSVRRYFRALSDTNPGLDLDPRRRIAKMGVVPKPRGSLKARVRKQPDISL